MFLKQIFLFAVVIISFNSLAATTLPAPVKGKSLFGDVSSFYYVSSRQAVTLTADNKAVRNIFEQFHKLFQFKAPIGKCIYIRAKFKVKDSKDKILLDGSMEIVRGDKKQFKLLLELKRSPLGGKFQSLALGCDSNPWIISSKGTLYSGQLETRKDSYPAKYFVAQVTQFQQLLSGIFSMAASGMFMPLDKWVKIEMKCDDNGRRYMDIRERKTQAKIYLDHAAKTPQEIFINSKKNKTEIIFTQWDLAAPVSPGIFSPAYNKNRKIVKVKQYNIDKMFAALVNFAVHKTQK